MHVSLLLRLRCPFCGGALRVSVTEQIKDTPEYGVLTCHCAHYPIVSSIPILRKGVIGTAGQTVDEVIALIEAGRHREALLALISPPAPAPAWIQWLPSLRGMGRLKHLAQQWAARGWREQLAALLRDQGDQMTACDLFDLYFRGSGLKMMNAYDYFAFRFGQPRHLVALSLASLVDQPKKLILDLACGFGHLTRSLVQRAKGQLVIGVDRNFFALYVAQKWVAPEAEYICCEADASLPFPDSAFSTVFCSDAFHYFVNKATSIRELKRLTQDDGLIVLVTLRNGSVRHQHACLPLPPEGYQALVADMSHRLVSDSDILAHYLQKQGPPLARSADLQQLTQEPLLSLVASHRPEVFQDHGRFEDWPHAEGRLALNPLFVAEKRDGLGDVYLRRTFPADFYEEENAECRQYMPEIVAVNSKTLIDLEHGERTPEMEQLIAQCVVLALPERYR
jgi:ubiquinone/menaquinone biosynthesis C-methylase UbiE/uncharacterized protein YbaR (Trm112 family)